MRRRFLFSAILMSSAVAFGKVAPAPVDWADRANSELSAAPSTKSKTKLINEKALAPAPAIATVLPTPATVRAEVQAVQPAIERTGLRMALMLEAYKPSGEGHLNPGETLDYSSLPYSPMAQVDLRWLPFVEDRFAAGGYAALGYSRQELPLVAASGFRYDDVTLNVLRAEAGGAVGYAPAEALNLELRLGAGRLSHIQTSRYPEFNGTYTRPYAILAVDLSYHFIPQVAALLSVGKRTPLADGSGSLAFETISVAGGLLVQLR